MTQIEPDKSPAKQEVQRWGRNLTLQNVVQLLAIGVMLSGFYFNTNSRLTAAEESQKKTNQILQFQQDWMISIGIKTGVGPPTRRE